MAAVRVRTALALTAALAGVAACASAAPPRPSAVDGARAYRIGYADGCSSGFKAAAGQRGGATTERGGPGGRDRLYLEGWVVGHYTCRLLAERPGWEI